MRFAFDGTGYEIDLNTKKPPRSATSSRLIFSTPSKAGRAQTRRPGQAAAGRQRSGDIRAWAKEHGLAVSERGRIPRQRGRAIPRRGQRALTQGHHRPDTALHFHPSAAN